MENEHELSYETLPRVYLGSYEHYKSVGSEVELLELEFELKDQGWWKWVNSGSISNRHVRGLEDDKECLYDLLFNIESSLDVLFCPCDAAAKDRRKGNHVTPVSTVSSHDNTANLSDATVYAFLANQPNGSQLVHEDLEQIHEDDLQEMDLKWQLALLSMRARRSHRNQESKLRNQDSLRKTVNMEGTSSKAMVAIDGASFDWSYMADDEDLLGSSGAEIMSMNLDLSYKDQRWLHLLDFFIDPRIIREQRIAIYKGYRGGGVEGAMAVLPKMESCAFILGQRSVRSVSVGNRTNGNAGSEINFDIGQAGKKKVLDQEYILLPLLNTCSDVSSCHEEDESSPKDDARKKSPVQPTCVKGEINSDVGQAGKEKVLDQEYILLPLLNTCSDVSSCHEEDESSPKDDAGKKSPVQPTCVKGVTMADTRTMAKLLQAPTEGYEEAIVVPTITADNFELKHGLVILVQNKEFFGHDNQFFPSKTTNHQNEITNFHPRFDKSFSEAWEQFKDLLRPCPHHGFSKLHQLDTFYIALNSNDQYSLNSGAGAIGAKVGTSSSTLGVLPDVSKLKDMVKALFLDKKNQSQAPATVKAVEESCITCGGAHSYRNCPDTDGNVYRDNIQEYVSQATAVNHNQGNTGYHPPMNAN
nr:hypothetical protein [Tanacetum cinerariifolium]